VLKIDNLRAAYDAHGEKVRFLAVGMWNTLFGYLLFAAVLYALKPALEPLGISDRPMASWLGAHYYLIAQWAAWTFSVPQSTLALKYLVFRSKGHWFTEVARSYLVYAPLQLLSFGLLWLFSGLLDLHPLLGQFLVSVIVAVLSYVGHKKITFRTVSEPPIAR
jgi:putative flippase GtrA